MQTNWKGSTVCSVSGRYLLPDVVAMWQGRGLVGLQLYRGVQLGWVARPNQISVETPFQNPETCVVTTFELCSSPLFLPRSSVSVSCINDNPARATQKA